MNLRGVDLNLLVILDALLREAHVSRAATLLAMSQPATSNALERCRRIFDDPLLERGDGGMRLTAKADSLREPIADLLARAASVYGITEPSLAEIRGKVRIVMADVLGTVIAPRLQAAVAAAAPGVDLILQPWGSGAGAASALINGRTDIAVTMLPPASSDLHIEDILHQTYVVAMRGDHPAARHLDLEAWLAWPHILVSAEGSARSTLDDRLGNIGRERRVGMVVPSFLVLPDILRGSDMIAHVPDLCTQAVSYGDLTIRRPPIEVDGFTIQIGWHRLRGQRLPITFVVDRIKSILGSLQAGSIPVVS